jgi:hypothetical protein
MQVSRHVRDVCTMSLKNGTVVAPSVKPRQYPMGAKTQISNETGALLFAL